MYARQNWTSAILAAAMLLLAVSPAWGATNEQIEQAIVKGLAWLAAQQNPDGSWGSSTRVACTGLVPKQASSLRLAQGEAAGFTGTCRPYPSRLAG